MKAASNDKHMSRKQWTQDFLWEYQLYRKLMQRATDDSSENIELVSQQPVGDSKPALAAVAKMNLEGLQVGQIRLLSQPDEMIRVLVLREWGNGIWLVVPFSPFPYPATDEEFFLGGRRTEYLDVLQFWNARTLHALFLRRSWIVDTLAPPELQQAEQIFDASISGDTLPDELLTRTALPITTAPDPRLDYKQENLARFAALDAADFEWNELCAEAAEEAVPELNLERTQVSEPATEQKVHFDPGLFSKLPLAAAGRSEISICWKTPLIPSALLKKFSQRRPAKKMCHLTRHSASAEEADGFRITEKETPHLLWKLPQDCRSASSDALFFHRESRLMLGTGYTVPEGEEGYIVLSDWCSEEHPDVDSRADITIFLTNPEQL